MSESQWQTNTMISFNTPKSQSYTLRDWSRNNRSRYQSSVNLQQSADDLIAKSDQIRDISLDVTITNKEETDHRLKEKITDIEYRKNEINHIRKQVIEELDAIEIYKNRLFDTLSSLKKNATDICEKCLKFREKRIGIDLVNDDVKRELLKEIVVIKGMQSLLEKTLEQAQEQIRKLKAAIYFIDCDLRAKDENINKNQTILTLKERNLKVKSVTDFGCNCSTATIKEWEHQTIKNIKDALREIKLAKYLRNYIDSIIRNSENDFRLQKTETDNAFARRIDETKEQKSKLEAYHAEIVEKVKEMSKNVIELEKSIEEKEGFLVLAQTRINTHCVHSDLENIRDFVQMNLVKEIRDLHEIINKLHETLLEARASLRILLKTQIQLEEDINIKLNTLKIDEVDCMTLRQALVFHAY